MNARWSLLVSVVALASWAAPVRLLISIGNDEGAFGDVTLHHAERDAARVSSIFKELGGVQPQNVVERFGNSAEQVEAELRDFAVRASELRASGQTVEVFVYVSSHASDGVLHLGPSTLSMERLRASVEALPADVRVLVIDACSSGAAARWKGGKPVPAVRSLEARPASGLVVITASGPAEPAQEWDSLEGSLFTFHWLAALRGQADADRDGRVTLLEAYAYAFRHTVAQADQHPSYDYDLHGAGELVLTEPSRSSSALSFAADLSGRLTVIGVPDANVVLELEKHAGAALRLALPPGQYRLRLRGADTTTQAELELRRDHLRGVSAADFASPTVGPTFATKGGARGFAMQMELALRGTPQREGGTWGAGGVLGRLDGELAWFGLGLCVGGGERALGVDRREEVELAVALSAGVAIHLERLRLALGGVARPTFAWGRSGDTTSFLFGVDAGPQVTVELGFGGALLVGVQLEGLVSARTGSNAPSMAIRGALLTGFRF